MIVSQSRFNWKHSAKVLAMITKKHKNTYSQPLPHSLNYCIDLVRKLDHDNYLCCLLLPENLRATAFAIRAFNTELSKIQEQTNEKHMGLTRVKFWEDCLDRVFNGKPPNHPVLQELFKATKRHKLSKIYLKKLIESRENQLNVSTFENMEDMENYADQTCTPIFLLLLEASNLKNSYSEDAASHIGIAQGLSNLIRSLPYNLRENVVLLPRTELLEHNVSEESLKRNSVNQDSLSKIISKIALKASHHLKEANSLRQKIPKDCNSLFLPATPIRIFLNKLEKSNFYIYSSNLKKNNGLLPFILYWNKLRKTY